MTGQPTTAEAVYRWYEANAEDGLRPHLGASLIGHHCERHLWLTFRWAARPVFPGRVRRLFDTGQREEARIVKELRGIGCEVHDTDPQGNQWRVSSFGGHFGGSMDAALRGIPDAPRVWCVGEFKTHNAKSFADLEKNGVQASKPMHYAQMQTYMGFTGMRLALYYAVCKDTDHLHTEVIAFDQAVFERLHTRAAKIVFAAEPPPRISEDAAWYQCKFCDHHALCHGEQAPLPTCRSCAHVTPEPTGTWKCEKYDCDLKTGDQRQACTSHRYIPILLEPFADGVDVNDDSVTYRHRATGKTFVNGPAPAGFSSREIHACADKAALDKSDDFLNTLRNEMGGTVVG